GLLGHPDRAHAAFADLLKELVLVRANEGAGAFGDRLRDGDGSRGAQALEEAAGFLSCPQQGFDFVAQQRVAAAGLIQISGSLRGRLQVHCLAENTLDVASFGAHGSASSEVSLFFSATMEAADCQKKWKFFGAVTLAAAPGRGFRGTARPGQKPNPDKPCARRWRGPRPPV